MNRRGDTVSFEFRGTKYTGVVTRIDSRRAHVRLPDGRTWHGNPALLRPGTLPKGSAYSILDAAQTASNARKERLAGRREKREEYDAERLANLDGLKVGDWVEHYDHRWGWRLTRVTALDRERGRVEVLGWKRELVDKVSLLNRLAPEGETWVPEHLRRTKRTTWVRSAYVRRADPEKVRKELVF